MYYKLLDVHWHQINLTQAFAAYLSGVHVVFKLRYNTHLQAV
jgi:hypothetical protein